MGCSQGSTAAAAASSLPAAALLSSLPLARRGRGAPVLGVPHNWAGATDTRTALALLLVTLGCLLRCGPAAGAPAVEVGGLAMPDGRAWELVSPPDKHGAGLATDFDNQRGTAMQAAADGTAITYAASAPAASEAELEPQGNRAFEGSQLLSRRGAKGWGTADLTTPVEEVPPFFLGQSTEYRLFSLDLSAALVAPKGETPLAPPQAPGEVQERTLYLRNDASGSYEPLVSRLNAPEHEIGKEGLLFNEGTPDLNHVVFTSSEALTSGALAGGENLYEWSRGVSPSEQIQLVSVSPSEGSPLAESPVHGNFGEQGQILRHVISDDGERIAWKELRAGEHSQLILRDTVTKESVRVDAPREGASGGAEEAIFQTASSDGTRVFFSDQGQLTPDSHAKAGADDLYLFEASRGKRLSEGRLTDLTVPLVVGESASVQGAVLGTSQDGSYVYFVANGVLTDVPSQESDKAAPGDCEGALFKI